MEDIKKQVLSLIVIFWFVLISGSSLWFLLDKISLKLNMDLVARTRNVLTQFEKQYGNRITELEKLTAAPPQVEAAKGKK